MTGQFCISVLDDSAISKATGEGETLYEGDDMARVVEILTAACNEKENAGKIVRLYNFAMFGGGMKEYKVEAYQP
jgi:hypothetical protein